MDLFCGIGGLSHGFYQEGFTVAAGIDVDEGCRHAFEHNNFAPFVRRDVAKIRPHEVARLFIPGRRKVLVGCAPCQPFSTYNQKNDDPKWCLLSHFSALIRETSPDVVSMENVPRLLEFRGGSVFGAFLDGLHDAGYEVAHGVLYCPDFGLAQSRSRLVVLASRLGPIGMPLPTHEGTHRTVRDEIGHLPALCQGQRDDRDILHCASRLSEMNRHRMEASRPGGTWRDWDQRLVAKCHAVQTGRGYSSVYGRMKWDEPSPTITTQFLGFGNGRFGHPEQSRALSLREGAMLQGFPRTYSFVRPGDPVRLKALGRRIGNAVPVKLASAIARTIKNHLGGYL